MGVKVSAVQAALLTGRNERRIRDWIATQRLPAIKVGQAWQIDTADLEHLPGITIDPAQLALLQAQETGTLQGLLNHVARLEQIIQDLHMEMASLTARIEHLEDGKAGILPEAEILQNKDSHPDLPRDTAIADVPGNALIDFTSYQDDRSLPPGSMRMKQFALMHKVHAAVLTYQIETGKIVDTPVGMANGRKSHWLTPQQQQEIIAFWRRNGTHFVPCPRCPHVNSR